MRPTRKGLTSQDSETVTIRITAAQRRRLKEVAALSGQSLGDIVRVLMLAGEIAFTDPKGFGKSFAKVARDTVLEDLHLPNDSPVETIRTEVLAEQVRRFGTSSKKPGSA
jgi:hypothetical protein